MTVPPHLELVENLGRAVAASSDQKDLLKAIKSEIIGHIEKKEQIVRHGVLDIIKQILVNADRARGKRGQPECNGAPEVRSQRQSWVQDEDVRLQAFLLLGSLANGGPPFLSAINSSETVPHLLSALSPKYNSSRTIVAALKAILAITDAESAVEFWSHSTATVHAPITIYTRHSVQCLAEILAQKSRQTAIQTQVGLVGRLIKVTCNTEARRNMLLDGGVLDLLAAHLASFYAYQETWTRWDELKHGVSLASQLTPPTLDTATHILGALAAIVNDSKYRAMRLASSPAVNNIFTVCPPDSPERHRSIAATAELGQLPRIPPPLRKSDEKQYPPLPSSQSSAAETHHLDAIDDSSDESHRRDACQTSLVTWLITTLRKYDGLCRVEAAHLLVLLCLSRAFQCEQPRMFCVVVVPALISEIEPAHTLGSVRDQMRAKELALVVLAKLCKPDPLIQRAAFDAGAIAKVCATLRKTFGPLDAHSAHWSPNRNLGDQTAFPASCRITRTAIPADVAHAFRVREGALWLLAAIAANEDSYRKQFTEAGMTAVIKDCMEPLSEEALAALEDFVRTSKKEKLIVKELGNPVPVLVAACNAARTLARSVSLLRTSLIDAGMAMPTFKLLRHSDVEVVKAATDVVCNLNPEFSPIRQDLVEAGVIHTLCENAQSADSELCLRSLWAIKHLIYQSPNDVKMSCLEKLGTGRLKLLITSEPSLEAEQQFHDAFLGLKTAASRDSIQYNAGMQDELIADEQMRDNERGPSEGAFNDSGDVVALELLNYKGPFITSPELQGKVFETFAQDRAQAFNSYVETALSIQRQSLDVIRNFIMGPKAPETVEFIFSRMQGPNIFEIVAEKIRNHRPSSTKASGNGASKSAATPSPSPQRPLHNSTTKEREQHPTTHSPQLLHSAIMILTHIAAGAPHQRQELISHHALMSLLLSLLAHPDAQIRVAVVFCVCNLTWVDDDADRRSAVQRASDLHQLGFVEGMERIQDDENMDVRERVNTARTQLYELLGMEESQRGFGGRRGR